jgi:hypothetical protein
MCRSRGMTLTDPPGLLSRARVQIRIEVWSWAVGEAERGAHRDRCEGRGSWRNVHRAAHASAVSIILALCKPRPLRGLERLGAEGLWRAIPESGRSARASDRVE